MFFRNLKDKSDEEKKIIGLVLSLIITLLIIGCYVVYKKTFVRDDGTSISFSELKQVKDIKKQFGEIFNFDNSSTTDVMLDGSSTTEEIYSTSSASTETLDESSTTEDNIL